MNMEIELFDSWLSNIKGQFVKIREINDSNFIHNCSSIIQNSENCITKIFQLITSIDECIEENYNNIVMYLNEAVCILQKLSGYFKDAIEICTINWRDIKYFPLATGQIIISVFTYCKQSELLYGVNMPRLEKELKDLFHCCHDLQFIYQEILLKYYNFDLSIHQDKDLLIQVLNLNLQIGEAVLTLDVKTMAEQWKSFTSLCEKYSQSLNDSIVFNTSADCLVNLIITNMKSIVEGEHDDKYLQRTLKVTNFLIKILIKIYQIFKDCTIKHFEQIVFIFVYIKTYCSQKLDSNISVVISHLLTVVMTDHDFADSFLNYHVEEFEDQELLLGYMHLLIWIMKMIATENDSYRSVWLNISKHQNIISLLFKLLPQCHALFNLDLKYNISSKEAISVGFYEHLLFHTASLVTTYDNGNYEIVEKCMFQAIFDAGLWRPLFACDLWIILTRYVSPKLVNEQMLFFCECYKKLTTNRLFIRSPQQIHLSNLLRRLFNALPKSAKIEMYERYPIKENITLWAAIKIENIPNELIGKTRIIIEDICKDHLKEEYLLPICSEDAYQLINGLLLLSSGPYMIKNDLHITRIFKAWNSLINYYKNKTKLVEDAENLCLIDYVTALCAITKNIVHDKGFHLKQLIQILENISLLIDENCPTTLKLAFIKLLFHVCYGDVLNTYNSRICAILENVLKHEDRLGNSFVYKHLISTSFQECTLERKEYLLNLLETKKVRDKKLSPTDQLQYVAHIKYSHKCLISHNGDKTEKCKSNFLLDFETLFSQDPEQSICKKSKVDSSIADEIICRLENEVTLLCAVKENIFSDEHRARIQNICEKLINI